MFMRLNYYSATCCYSNHFLSKWSCSQRVSLDVFSLEVFHKAGPWSDCPSWKVPRRQMFGCTEEEGVVGLVVATGSPVEAGCACPLGSAAVLRSSPGPSGSETRRSCWGWGRRTPRSGRRPPRYPPCLWSSPSGRGCAATRGFPLLGTGGLGCEPAAALGCIRGWCWRLPTPSPWHPLHDGNRQPPPGSCCRAGRVGSWKAGRRSAALRSYKGKPGLGCGRLGHLSPPHWVVAIDQSAPPPRGQMCCLDDCLHRQRLGMKREGAARTARWNRRTWCGCRRASCRSGGGSAPSAGKEVRWQSLLDCPSPRTSRSFSRSRLRLSTPCRGNGGAGRKLHCWADRWLFPRTRLHWSWSRSWSPHAAWQGT